MQTAPSKSLPAHPLAVAPGGWGLGVAAAGFLVVALYLFSPRLGLLLIAGLAGVVAVLAAFRWPMALAVVYWPTALFNYGRIVGPGVFKIGEVVIGLMVVTALLRLAAGDAELRYRVRRGGHVLAALALLAIMAVATAFPHPNVYNVRYEVQNAIAMAFGLLFFQRRHWPLLIGLFCATMLVESLAALFIKYGMDLTGLNYATPGGGIERVWLTSDDLESLAGGLFRLSGTFGHKNLLAAFFVLLLPLASLELLRRPGGLLPAALVLGPALMTLGLTDSMTGWGTTVLLIVVALGHLRRFDYLAVFSLMLLPVAALALIKFGGSIFFRVEQLFGGTEAGFGTVSSRLEIFNVSQRLIAEHPWFGIGRNNFADYGETYYTHAHNMFLMKTIETGVAGGLMFAIFIVGVLAHGWKTLLTDAPRLGRQGQYYRYLGVWLGCLGFTAMNMLDYSYANFSLGPMYMLMLGILLAMAWDDEADGGSISAAGGSLRERP
jgi:hypothetical protein